ncbi:hypothetical protein ABHN05_18140 [Brevibacillus laterosporus]|uniref:hypothetical protein n=1 Tax=Brevibacillus laterosporus TaxID=1465 RepID=UPI00112E1D92|nr:hypothetical protein [Brevibacillus laterosporus]MBG9800650.1 hypothetical protein [Brevibacillus laterosporus]MED4764853.1 hypothetical protein [Brevibacillus laterosporus]TPH17269.1 hypothetical protein EGH09_09820 [Brevibacillus laterosporus]
MWYSSWMLTVLMIGYTGWGGDTANSLRGEQHTQVIQNELKIRSVKELTNESQAIIHATALESINEQATDRSVQGRRVVKYTQTFQVKTTLKGNIESQVRIIFYGLEPKPVARDPLNLQYPGALGDGEYFLFLKKLDSNSYTTVDKWQGIYPIFGGRTVALEGQGISELNGLTPNQMIDKIKQITRQ